MRVFTIACASGMKLMDEVLFILGQEHPNQPGPVALLIHQKGSSRKHRRQRAKDGKAEATKGPKRKKARSEASGHKHKGYDGDDAITKIGKHGAKEGWIVECYPPEGLEHERCFLKVQDGSTYVAENGERTIRNLRWLAQGSLTKLAKGYGPESLEIKMVKAYGEPHYFSL